ncbi:MAG: hypothetical protein ACI8X5_002288, partial [Planctomycetota bacterium]
GAALRGAAPLNFISEDSRRGRPPKRLEPVGFDAVGEVERCGVCRCVLASVGRVAEPVLVVRGVASRLRAHGEGVALEVSDRCVAIDVRDENTAALCRVDTEETRSVRDAAVTVGVVDGSGALDDDAGLGVGAVGDDEAEGGQGEVRGSGHHKLGTIAIRVGVRATLVRKAGYATGAVAGRAVAEGAGASGDGASDVRLAGGAVSSETEVKEAVTPCAREVSAAVDTGGEEGSVRANNRRAVVGEIGAACDAAVDHRDDVEDCDAARGSDVGDQVQVRINIGAKHGGDPCDVRCRDQVEGLGAVLVDVVGTDVQVEVGDGGVACNEVAVGGHGQPGQVDGIVEGASVGAVTFDHEDHHAVEGHVRLTNDLNELHVVGSGVRNEQLV